MNLKDIKSPQDIKGMNTAQLTELSNALREAFLNKVSAHGGHVGPNLGALEATVALHYVFNAPTDKLVFDVSHQTYIHKMLTGRIEAFLDPAKYDDVTGYTSPAESPYDLFEVGHTSTSISLATGLAKARDLHGGKENVVAFIGDASLGGGMALEALSYAPELKSNIIVVLNDNQMSIAENHGALYHHLTALRESNGTAANNIFKALGYEYVYVADGNDVAAVIKAFEAVKDSDHAVLVHLNTLKGHGFAPAVEHKEAFHWSMPFNKVTGALLHPFHGETYDGIFAKHMQQKIAADKNVLILVAGTPGVIGFGNAQEREALGANFVDVGICEQDCVTMAAGLAKGGAKPVMGVGASFVQRTYDQLSHDLGINSLPAVIVDFYTGVFGLNDMTHLGFFDIAMMSNIPNFVMLAPTCKEEYVAAIDWALTQRERPVVVRTPGGPVLSCDRPVDTDFFKYDVVESGSKVALIGAGSFLKTALEAAAIMKQNGVTPTVINPRNLTQLDTATLDTLRDYDLVITLEDGIIDGGFGQKVAAYLGTAPAKVVCLGLRKEFVDRYDSNALLEANGLLPEQIADLVKKA